MNSRGGNATVARWGEQRLIQAIRRWLGSACPPAPAGIGDDCAVLEVKGRERSAASPRLITVDPIVYGRHFDDSVSWRDAGAKLLKRNLSDIAAMGGRPTAAVVGLLLSGDIPVRWLESFYRGLAATARRHGTAIVGGDIAQGPEGARRLFSAHLTLLGSLPQGRAVTRAGAANGDVIYVTGVLGGSLRSGHHVSFTPRLAEGEWLAGRREVRAMMDVSDGLAKDLPAMAPRGTVPALDPAAVPVRQGCTLAQALSDGEDYELVFAVAGAADAAAFEAGFRRRFPRLRLSRLGVFLPPRRVPAGSVNLAALHGYEHFR